MIGLTDTDPVWTGVRPIRSAEQMRAALGPYLVRVLEEAPVWDDHELPPRRHRCAEWAEAGGAKFTTEFRLRNPETGLIEEWKLQVCACGGHRYWCNGRPTSRRWTDKNRARKDARWFTRADHAPDGVGAIR